MSLTLDTISGGSQYKQILVSPEYWIEFQELIQRGSNLWPDAPPEIKRFADLVTNGKVMQDYDAQSHSSSTKKT